MDSPALSIREIAQSDADAAARLSGELGYEASAEAMSSRIASLTGNKDRIVFVACLGVDVVGWIEISVTHHLASETRVEIGGLVVSDGVRGQGIGRKLVAHAEQWAVEQGVTLMLVRSRVTREAAHRFYLREGYERTKTSAVFTKELMDRNSPRLR